MTEVLRKAFQRERKGIMGRNELVRKLVRGGYVSEQIVLVGRDVDVQNPPDFDQYASSMNRLSETTPFNSPFSLVETPSR